MADAYAVFCGGLMPGHSCGRQVLTEENYWRQMKVADDPWRCPLCRAEAEWDDEGHQEWLDGLEDSPDQP